VALAMSVETQDDGDLAALLTEERLRSEQPVLNRCSRRDSRQRSFSPDSRRSAAARRLLTRNGP